MAAPAPVARLSLCVLAGLLLGRAAWAGSPVDLSTSPVSPDRLELLEGVRIYSTICAACHGSNGRADTHAAHMYDPPPRDFTKGLFKIRSTPTGTLPTDEDLLETLVHGIPGTEMPPNAYLSDPEKRAVLRYLKRLVAQEVDGKRVNLFESRGQGRPLPMPDPPPKGRALIPKGRRLYRELQCAGCHGEEGRGDGPLAPALTDDSGRRARPTDFTAGIFKGGDSVRDIYLRLAAGMDGTPMGSYLDAVDDPKNLWALAAYVRSLSPEKPFPEGASGPLAAQRLASGRRPKPEDRFWKEVPETTLYLRSDWMKRRPIPKPVRVRAAHDAESVTLRMEWKDPIPQGRPLARAASRADLFDALQVALSTSPSGGPGMILTTWRSDRDPAEIELPLEMQEVIESYRELWPEGAVDFRGPPAPGSKDARGRWSKDGWKVAVRVRLPPAYRTRRLWVSVAVFDYGRPESEGLKSESPWVPLVLRD